MFVALTMSANHGPRVRLGVFFALARELSWQIEIVDPEGGAQDVRRFSMRQDASSKNPCYPTVRSLEVDLACFLWLLSLRQRK
jgi:hypothetical protein